MKTDLSMAELLALVEIVDEHVGRNFHGVDPPRLLREIQEKLDSIVIRHRAENHKPPRRKEEKSSGADR
jgi:hypothetical protein